LDFQDLPDNRWNSNDAVGECPTTPFERETDGHGVELAPGNSLRIAEWTYGASERHRRTSVLGRYGFWYFSV